MFIDGRCDQAPEAAHTCRFIEVGTRDLSHMSHLVADAGGINQLRGFSPPRQLTLGSAIITPMRAIHMEMLH